MGRLVSFTIYIVTSETTEMLYSETKIGFLILAEIKRGELATQMAVMVQVQKLRKHVNRIKMIYEYT